MNNARRYVTTMALFAVVLGILASLAGAAINAMPDDEPLSTNAAMAAMHTPSVAEVPPDSRRLFKTHAVPTPKPVVTPPVLPVTAPKPAAPAPNTIRKPKPPVEAPQHAPAPPARASSRIEAAVTFALAQQGKPYVWGATGPRAFDCSGLVVTAFKHAGISLPRTTKTIIGRGTAVSRSAMLRGDLVWTSSGHMGIYLGEGKMIHAPQSGDVVKVSTVWSFYAARRL